MNIVVRVVVLFAVVLLARAERQRLGAKAGDRLPWWPGQKKMDGQGTKP